MDNKFWIQIFLFSGLCTIPLQHRNSKHHWVGSLRENRVIRNSNISEKIFQNIIHIRLWTKIFRHINVYKVWHHGFVFFLTTSKLKRIVTFMLTQTLNPLCCIMESRDLGSLLKSWAVSPRKGQWNLMSERDQSTAQETIGLPPTIKRGYLHFQIDDCRLHETATWKLPWTRCSESS